MSARARYGFAVVVALFGIYQFRLDNPILGVIGFALAGVFLWLVPKH